MAGAVRQPINVASLSAYIEKNVAEIELPISLKQVLSRALHHGGALTDIYFSSASVNQILRTSSVEPMERTMYYERNHQASCFPRLHTRSNANFASSTPWRAQMSPSRKRTACAKTQRSSVLLSISCSSWMDAYSRMHHFQASIPMKETRCEPITP